VKLAPSPGGAHLCDYSSGPVENEIFRSSIDDLLHAPAIRVVDIAGRVRTGYGCDTVLGVVAIRISQAVVGDVTSSIVDHATAGNVVIGVKYVLGRRSALWRDGEHIQRSRSGEAGHPREWYRAQSPI